MRIDVVVGRDMVGGEEVESGEEERGGGRHIQYIFLEIGWTFLLFFPSPLSIDLGKFSADRHIRASDFSCLDYSRPLEVQVSIRTVNQ